MLDAASFLKRSANLLVAIGLVKLVLDDLRHELRHDAEAVRAQTRAVVRRSPYRAAGAAAALGVFTGLLVSRHRRRGVVRTDHA